jgi:hypothetical protein
MHSFSKIIQLNLQMNGQEEVVKCFHSCQQLSKQKLNYNVKVIIKR